MSEVNDERENDSKERKRVNADGRFIEDIQVFQYVVSYGAGKRENVTERFDDAGKEDL